LPKSLQVWNSHGDKLTKIPNGFKPVAVTEIPNTRRLKTARGNFSGCSFIPKSFTRRAGAKSSPISSIRSAAAARVDDAQLRRQAVEEIRAQVVRRKLFSA